MIQQPHFWSITKIFEIGVLKRFLHSRFIALLFIIAKLGNQSIFLNVVHMHKGLAFHLNKERNSSVPTQIELKGIMLMEKTRCRKTYLEVLTHTEIPK